MSAPKHDPDAEDLDAITLLNGRIDQSTRCSDLPDPKNPESPDRRQSAQKTPAKEMPRDKAGKQEIPFEYLALDRLFSTVLMFFFL